MKTFSLSKHFDCRKEIYFFNINFQKSLRMSFWGLKKKLVYLIMNAAIKYILFFLCCATVAHFIMYIYYITIWENGFMCNTFCVSLQWHKICRRKVFTRNLFRRVFFHHKHVKTLIKRVATSYTTVVFFAGGILFVSE